MITNFRFACEQDPTGNYICVFDINEHLHIYTFTAETYHLVLRALGQMASNPDIPFTWFNAAQISKALKEWFSGRQPISR